MKRIFSSSFLFLFAAVALGQGAGSIRWEFAASNRIGLAAALGPDGTIYFGSDDRRLYALSPQGNLRWTYTTGGEIQGSPVVGADGVVHVGSADRRLHAVNPDGSARWTFMANGALSATPCVAGDGAVYFVTEAGTLYSVKSPGAQQWSRPVGVTYRCAPVIGTNGWIIAGSNAGLVVAHTSTGIEQWRVELGSPVSQLAVGSDGTIYATTTSAQTLFAIRPDGEPKWEFRAGGILFAAPVIDPGGTIYFGALGGSFHALDAGGTEKWRFQAGDDISASAALAADGNVCFGSGDGVFHVLSPAGNHVWSIDTPGGLYGAPLLTADQSVLYSWYNTLYAVNLDSPPAESAWPTFGRDAQRTGDSTRLVPPLIVLTRPLEETTILVGESLDLVAAAAPGGAPITNVTFYAGETFLAGLAAAPYSMSWSNPPVGIHRLTATVTDLRGLTGTSAPVVVTVDTRLDVSLTQPQDGAVLFQPISVLLEVAIEEIDAMVTNVVFRADDLLLGEVHTPPFRFTWTNAPVGDHVLTAVATDALGAWRQSAPNSVTIHPADALVAVDDAFDVAEDTPRTIAVPGVKSNDINRNPGVALVELVDPPVHGTLTLNSDGSFHYLPSTNYFGPDEFEYRLVLGDRTSAPATVHLTILAMSDVPVALGDSIAVLEDGRAEFTLAGIDPDGEPLTFRIVDAPVHGTFYFDPTGSSPTRMIYWPARHFHGADAFTFAVHNGTAESAPATVELTVVPVPDAPQALADLYTVVPGQTLVVDARDGVLVNDEDGDGEPIVALLVQNPNHGVLELTPDGSFVYRPEPGFIGRDEFVYRASDGDLESLDTKVVLGVGNNQWDARFVSPRLAGQWVTALALGPAGELDVGGTFGLRRWDGNTWTSPAGSSMGNVDALAWWRNQLYAGGDIGEAGGQTAPGIAQWDGHGWTGVGGGVMGHVHALVATDDALYAAGEFLSAGGVRANRVARWNGIKWSPLGTGLSGVVRALAISPDGQLFAGGEFDRAGEVPVSHVAVWNGKAWSALGTGVNGIVRALAVADGALYVGGTFTVAGGRSATNVARWQGDAWSALGGGVPGDGVVALTPVDGAVLAGQTYEASAGYRPVRVFRWTGTAWAPMEQQFTGQERNRISALLPMASGLVAGGYFREVGGAAIDSLAVWDGSRWHALDLGLNGAVEAFSAQGNEFHVGGTFVSAGHVAVNHIARWDGDHWQPLGVGDATGVNGRVRALARGPDGDLFVGGHFLEAGAQPANRIARWDGTGWHALGTGPNNGVNGTVRALVFGDRGELYVGGEFDSAGGLNARGVARWQDGAWNDLGGGVNYQVYALVWNGGNLYAGGSFMTAGDVPARSVARWDGTRWHPLGSGIESLDASPVVMAMAARGTDLYVGGQFQPGATEAGQHLRRWDGAVWHDLPGPFDYSGRITSVAALEVVGDHLYVGGTFARIAGEPMHGIARWDGTQWQGLGTGTGPATSDSSVNAIALHGSDLFVGGSFGEAGSRAALRIGAWRLPNQPPRVEIIDPSPDALFHTGADITLAADAIDPDGTVTRVRFLVDGIVVGETQGPDFEVVWPDVFAGVYQVAAEATDNTGTTTASTARQVRVVPPPWNLSPTVTWLSPAAGVGFTAGDAILLEAEAQDEDGSIRQVTFYADNEALGVVHAAPYRLTWSNPTPGTVALRVIAMDNLGATSEPAILAVPFQYPPEVYMSQPYNGDRFVDPATIDLAADARDPDGEIVEVEFFVNGEFLAVAETISSPNYYYRWLDVPAGQYIITSAATDDFGARVLSAPITIHVEPPNLPPEIRILSPAADSQFTAPTNMVVVTEAIDPDGEIVRVDLLSHDLLLATTTNAPFTFALRNLTATTYCLVARAMDDRGAASTSEPVCVTVTYDPERVPRYTFKDLGAGVLYEGQAYGLNERGVVVGDGQNLNRDQRGFLYQDGLFTFLTMPNEEFPGFQSTPLAVNDAGVVVGYASDGSGAARAFVLEDGRMRNLGAFSEPHLATASFAFAINSSGVVVGSAEVPERIAHAFRYAGGPIEDLGMFGGIESVARAINDRGDIVGHATLGIDDVQAFLLPHAGPVQFLGTLGGARSQAHGISSSGLIVGNSQDDRDATKAFLNYWGYMVDLGTLGGSESHALAVNRYDQIVGSARNIYGEPRAFLWHGTVMYDLNQLVPTNTPVTLIEALDINDAGQIVGYGYADIHSRQPTPFLLSLAEDSPVKPQDGQLLRYAGDRFHLALPVPIGQAFVLEVSTDFGYWTPVSTNYNRTGLVEFDDRTAGQSSARFYRAVPLP